jgi:hypothetical protein
MDRLVISNTRIYKAIADEAYQKMTQLVKASRRPKPDGSAGWIITLDPNQNSFKQSMISIVFTGMWLEALLHLLIVKKYGEEKFREYDFKSYKEKLQLLGFTCKKTLDSVSSFHKTRKSLVHEKACFDDGEIKMAQDEAENAHEILVAINNHFSEELHK